MNGNLEHVKVEGHYGRYYEIGERFLYEGKRYIILEHEMFGNDIDWVVVEAHTDRKVFKSVENEDILEMAYAIV